jgi:hypothetical protein
MPWCPISLLEYPATFLGVQSRTQKWCFHLLVTGTWLPISWGKLPTRYQWICWSDGETCLSQCTGEWVLVAQKNTEKAQEPTGSPGHQTGKNLGSNNRHAFRRQKERLITSQRHLTGPIEGETMSLRFREWDGSVWAYMYMCACKSETWPSSETSEDSQSMSPWWHHIV